MKSKVIIIIEGGCVQNILCDSQEVETFLIDYDVESIYIEEEEVVDIPYSYNFDDRLYEGIDKALCRIYPAEVNSKEVERLHEIIINSYKNED
jgi:hypothetical protein